MDLIKIAPLIGGTSLGLGIALRIIGSSWERKRMREGGGGQYELMTGSNLREKLIALQKQNPDLPMVPSDATFYEVWFSEVQERIKTRAVIRTAAEQTKLARQINELKTEYLHSLKTDREILQAQIDFEHDKVHAQRRAERTEDLEEQRYQAERAKLEIEIAEARQKLEYLKDKRSASGGRQDLSPRERKLSALSRLDEEEKRKLSECESEAERERVKLIYEAERMRIMEGG